MREQLGEVVFGVDMATAPSEAAPSEAAPSESPAPSEAATSSLGSFHF